MMSLDARLRASALFFFSKKRLAKINSNIFQRDLGDLLFIKAKESIMAKK